MQRDGHFGHVRGVVAGESGRLRGRGRDAPLRMLED